MNLKEKIIELLQGRKYSYSDLANYLEISETELDSCLENPASQIRMLEEISKALSAPLYGFFKEETMNQVVLSSSEVARLKEEVSALKQEIERLKEELKNKKSNTN